MDPLLNTEGQMGSAFFKNAQREVRMGFVKKVYGILSVQLLATVIVAAPISTYAVQMAHENPSMVKTMMIGSAVLSLATLCAMTCCSNLTKQFPTNYLLLGAFTLSEAVMVGFVCARYPPQLVLGCAAMTAAIFVGLSIYAWTTTTDFTGMGPYLAGALIAMVIFMVGVSFFGIGNSPLQKGIAGIMVLLFTFYIIYDTQLMLGEFKGHKVQFGVDDYVFAALNLYLDILNLFLYLLQLFGSRDN